jgi:hypothetical protein
MLSLIPDLTALPVWLLCGAPVALFVFVVILAIPYLRKFGD